MAIRVSSHGALSRPLKRIECTLIAWGDISDDYTKQVPLDSLTRLFVSTLQVVQHITTSDLGLILSIYKSGYGAGVFSGVDVGLLKTFEETLDRGLCASFEVLSLPDLLKIYIELVQISVSSPQLDVSFANAGRAILSRVRDGEAIPMSFPVGRFLDVFRTDLDEGVLTAVSEHMLHKVKLGRQRSELSSDLVALEQAYVASKCQVSLSFIESVRIFVC